MPDPRVAAYARLLVERCVHVEPKWQVLVNTSPLARPLAEEVARAIAQRGAYAIVQLSYASIGNAWAEAAPEELLGELPDVQRYAMEHCDAYVGIGAPENTRDGSAIEPARLTLLRKAGMAAQQRIMADLVPWVACQYPTPALAQDAGMATEAFADFLYGACLLGWDAEAKKMERVAERFNQTHEVRLVGVNTDLRLSLAGRTGIVDDGHYNMPGGEVFYGPVEDATEGVVTFGEFPAVWGGREVEGARLAFQGGRVVDASAQRNEETLIKTLDADEGARVLGEFGIGCNPGVTRFLKNTLFDEKMAGTIHLALGASYPVSGGTNVSSVHWDMVKDLRDGGQIWCDGQLVQENGTWVFKGR